ncbi:MAG: hypothetical protein HKP11_00705, partial [Flavobacteriaceae bacterium]|nr:hypothetical protein [Flavobacteriaceae bacterium]
MKKLVTLVFGILLMSIPAQAASSEASSASYYEYDGNAYIFIEGAVEFSVFPDGQFDFVYLGRDARGNVNVNINTNNVNLNFNSGYNYDPFVQYDDYGAVIQIEDIPIYYDNYGRIIQAGNTEIRYNNRRIVRVGGLRVFYNYYGNFSYCTGFINLWTPRYIYRPWHVWYVRPFYTSCIVYDYPYRQFYRPHRYPYNYHRQHYRGRRVAYNNGRRNFYRPGSRVHYRDGRTAVNRDYNPNRRNSMVSANSGRRDGLVDRKNNRNRNNKVDRSSSLNRKNAVSKRSDNIANNRGRPVSNKAINRGAPTTNRKSSLNTNKRGNNRKATVN